jgi:hypothetical protein
MCMNFLGREKKPCPQDLPFHCKVSGLYWFCHAETNLVNALAVRTPWIKPDRVAKSHGKQNLDMNNC